jgi:hypothetical protein
MSTEETASELRNRIQNDMDYFDGELPERFAIAWRSYLAGLLEWGILDVPRYYALTELIPDVSDDPAVVILRGRD